MRKARKGKRKKKPLPIFVSADELVELVRHTRSRHHRIAFVIAWECGLRISEVIKLKKEDVDVENERMIIREGKGGKDRVVQLPCTWQSYFFDYIPMPCTQRALQKAFEVAAIKSRLMAKKPGVHFHSLRHGYATYLTEKDVDIRHIQQLLGHEDISTTMIYSHIAPVKSLKAANEAFL